VSKGGATRACQGPKQSRHYVCEGPRRLPGLPLSDRLVPRAAAQGDLEGQFNLALMYENGTGVPQDPHAAMSWYRAAADQGHTEARARAVQAQQHAQREQEPHLDSKMLRDGIEFAGEFQKLLREIAENAPGTLRRDPFIARTEFSSLYSG